MTLPEELNWRPSSRRAFLRRALVVGTGLIIAGVVTRTGWRASEAAGKTEEQGQPGRSAEGRRPDSESGGFEAWELSMVTALAGHMIPADGNGPGALEVGVIDRISRLAQDEQTILGRYRLGLAAFDQIAQKRHKKSFIALDSEAQLRIMRLVDEARIRLWDSPATSFWEKLERKANWYYYQWYGITNDAIELFDTTYAHTAGFYYSSKQAWDSVGYDGPPFPFGYVGRVSKC